MSRPVFYHSTIKNLIVSFASIFDDVHYINDYNQDIKIPLHYSPKEKFAQYYKERGDFQTDTNLEMVLPRMGFEMGSNIKFAAERLMNPMHRVQSDDKTGYMYNRLPYDFPFTLRIATKKFEDSLKIVEQIIPFFTPELNITVNDKERYDFKTDIPVVLNSSSYEVDYEGDFNTTRSKIIWTLEFTIKAWLYGDEKITNTIKKTIIDLTQEDMNKKFETLISEIVPFEANKEDSHTIIDSIIEGNI